MSKTSSWTMRVRCPQTLNHKISLLFWLIMHWHTCCNCTRTNVKHFLFCFNPVQVPCMLIFGSFENISLILRCHFFPGKSWKQLYSALMLLSNTLEGSLSCYASYETGSTFNGLILRTTSVTRIVWQLKGIKNLL